MKKCYNVLWFDDEYESLESIVESASLADVNLFGFSNAEAGLNELQRNITRFDSVIVDGLFYISDNHESGIVTQNAMAEVATYLKKIEDKRKIPWFILSGQTSFTKEKNPFAEFYKNNKVYDKLSNNDLEQLWLDIKAEADLQLETQIRHKYSDVIEVCTEKYIGLSSQEILIDILFALENSEINITKYFPQIRKIIESLFYHCDLKGLFPEDCIKTNQRSKFLQKKFMHPYVPEYLQYIIQSAVYNSQEGSHMLTIENDVLCGNAPYLFKCTVLELLNILVWFKHFSDENPGVITIPIQDSENRYEIEDTILPFQGIIEQDEYGNFHCGEYLLNFKYTKENYNIGDLISITKHQSNTNLKNNQSYPFYAIEYLKIEEIKS